MNVIRIVRYTVLTAAFAFSICGSVLGQHKNFILVIDPGHGGKDPGAVYGRYREKDLNLEIALALGAMIGREMSGVDVLYTRTDDRAVGLAARGDFANRAGADLFLSIHTNSAKSSAASGTETYVMGMDKSEANLEVTKLENEVIRYEEDYTETYADFDPSSTELSIIFGMLQFANFESSLRFARLIQKRYAESTPLKDRGARQAPFAVLWKPTMPRVLTETGFIGNEKDRKYIFSDKGRKAIVRALFDAFREYMDSSGSETTSASTEVRQKPVAIPAPAAPVVTAPPPVSVETPPARVETPVARDESNPAPSATTTATTFHVQLAAARTRIPTRDVSWGPYRGKVVERVADGWYKYSLGPYSTRRQAAEALGEARRGKFREAFIVEIESNTKK